MTFLELPATFKDMLARVPKGGFALRESMPPGLNSLLKIKTVGEADGVLARSKFPRQIHPGMVYFFHLNSKERYGHSAEWIGH
jgi:hypothetical protein